MKVDILADGRVMFLRNDIADVADKTALSRLFEMMLKAHGVDRQVSSQQIDLLLNGIEGTALITAGAISVQTAEGTNETKIVASFETLRTL